MVHPGMRAGFWHDRTMRYAILLLAACEPAAPPPAKPAPTQPAMQVPAPTSELDARFVPAIKQAAQGYTAWGRVDEFPRVAPAPCAAAPRPGEGVSHVRMSAAADGPHGKKLYFLWANQRDTYMNGGAFRPGFAIVKQSFQAVPGGDPHTYGEIKTLLTDAGERLQVGPAKDLFVMTKVAAGEGTDAGWVYGTVAVDGTVTSAGRVASCMKCHDSDAAHEKLFGLAPAPKYE